MTSPISLCVVAMVTLSMMTLVVVGDDGADFRQNNPNSAKPEDNPAVQVSGIIVRSYPGGYLKNRKSRGHGVTSGDDPNDTQPGLVVDSKGSSTGDVSKSGRWTDAGRKYDESGVAKTKTKTKTNGGDDNNDDFVYSDDDMGMKNDEEYDDYDDQREAVDVYIEPREGTGNDDNDDDDDDDRDDGANKDGATKDGGNKDDDANKDGDNKDGANKDDHHLLKPPFGAQWSWFAVNDETTTTAAATTPTTTTLTDDDERLEEGSGGGAFSSTDTPEGETTTPTPTRGSLRTPATFPLRTVAPKTRPPKTHPSTPYEPETRPPATSAPRTRPAVVLPPSRVTTKPLPPAPDNNSHWSRRTEPHNPRTASDVESQLNVLSLQYGTCHNCMAGSVLEPSCGHDRDRLHRLKHQFDKVMALLANGCHDNDPGKCCHRTEDVEGVIRSVSDVIGVWKNVLRKQCEKCPVDCKTHPWTGWTPCPTRCDHQTSTRRYRRVEQSRFGGKPCGQMAEVEEKECPYHKTVASLWSHWGSWSSCSSDCNGFRKRSRQCASALGLCVQPCEGETVQVEECSGAGDCCVASRWSHWGSWSSCSSDCNGFRKRSRQCASTGPRGLCAKPCDGETMQVEECSGRGCCVTAAWSTWSDWDSCDKDGGFRLRTRMCQPREQGKPICPNQCSGTASERSSCPNADTCNPSTYSQWSPWTRCSNRGSLNPRRGRSGSLNPGRGRSGSLGVDADGRECGTGSRSRSRICNIGDCPTTECSGPSSEDQTCMLRPCCVPASWNEWTDWGQCVTDSVGTKLGSQTRYRHCQIPGFTRNRRLLLPELVGPTICIKAGCAGKGNEIEERTCQPNQCPAPCGDPSWSGWSAWSNCVFDSQTGTGSRSRRATVCYNPSKHLPHCNPASCHGSAVQTEGCCSTLPETLPATTRTPCIPRTLYPWGQWSPCIEGIKTRERFCSVAEANSCLGGCSGHKKERKPCYCEEFCNGREDGFYPSKCKKGCRFYIKCCDGVQEGDVEMCQAEHGFNFHCQACTRIAHPDSLRLGYSVLYATSLVRNDPKCAFVPPLDPAPCAKGDHCDESCVGKVDGFYPTTCKPGCRNYFKCCNGVIVPDSANQCDHTRPYYNARCQCCVSDWPSSCSPKGNDDYTGPYLTRSSDDTCKRVCKTYETPHQARNRNDVIDLDLDNSM